MDGLRIHILFLVNYSFKKKVKLNQYNSEAVEICICTAVT